MFQFKTRTLAATALGLAFTTMASAQATRTWVSGVGDDANPCSRTAPCKTFAGAISKTAAGGEIDALDPGGYGGVTITKAITLDGGAGQVASILVAGTNAIVIAAGATDNVIVRNLALNGIAATGSPGLNGIQINSAASVTVDNVGIHDFSQSGINVNTTSASTRVSISNTSISGTGVNGSNGIHVSLPNAGVRTTVSISHTGIRNTQNGVYAQGGTTLVSDSVISNVTGTGLLSENPGTELTSEGNMIVGNVVALQPLAGSTLRISDSGFYNNQTGFACGTGGAVLASTGNNRKGSNVGGALPVCAPTTTIAVQ